MSTDIIYTFNNPALPVKHTLLFKHEDEPDVTLMGFEALTAFGAISVGDHISTRGWKLGLKGRGLIASQISHETSFLSKWIGHKITVSCRWSNPVRKRNPS